MAVLEYARPLSPGGSDSYVTLWKVETGESALPDRQDYPPATLPPVDDAINARTMERVRADVLAQRRGWRTQDFVCPGCRNPVQLRNGRRRAPHFAHLPGFDTEDCLYYHAGLGGGGGGVWESEPSPLPLYLEVRTGPAGESVWALKLAIPRTESPRGRIIVVDGITGRSSLSCAALVSRGKRVPVRPQESDYRIEATSDVSSADAERVTVGSPGLDADAPSLFRTGVSGGRRLLEDDSLTWGESYFAISSSDTAPVFPPGVMHKELAVLGNGYRGSVFQLPLETDERVRVWVADKLYRRVTAPGVSLTVVSPLIFPGLDEELRVDAREEVLVAISSPAGTHHLGDLKVVDDETGIVRRVSLEKGPNVLFVGIGMLGQRRVTVSAEDETGDSVVKLTLAGYKRPMRVTVPGVQLIASEAIDSATPRAVPLHSRAASKLLTCIRDAQATLEDIRLPPRVSCQVRVAGQVLPMLAATDPAYRYELVESAKQVLSEGRPFEIDAQSFGRVAVPARHVANPPVSKVWRLTAAWRRRIRAVATLATSRSTVGAVSSLGPQLVARLNAAMIGLEASDAALLRNFAGLHWKTGALPQARVLVTEIVRSSSWISQRSERTS